MHEMTFSELVDKYASYHRACGMKERSLLELRYFYNACGKKFDGNPCLNQSMIDWWWEKRDTETAVTYRSRLNKVVPFLKYITLRELAHLAIPKAPPYVESNTPPHFFSDEELGNLFRACDEIEHCKTKEQKLRKMEVPVVFRLLYSSGMRCVEVRMLDRSDVGLDSGVVRITKSKGYRERIIVLHDTMREIMAMYDDAMDAIMPDRKVFFPDIHDGYRKDKWLSAQFRECWYKYNDVTAYPRELRHQYAIENINSWSNRGYETNDRLVSLKNSMGHSKVSRTLSYYALVPQYADLIESRCEKTMEEVIPVIQ